MNQAWVKHLPRPLQEKVEGRLYLQNIISNTGWLFADRVFRAIVGLAVGIWMARYLGPEQFGLYNYSIAFVSLFSGLATLGLDSVVVRDLAREPLARDRLLGTAFFLKVGSACATLLLVLTVIVIARPAQSLTHWLVAIIAAGMIFQSFDAVDFWFQSQLKSRQTVYAKISAFTLIAVLKIVLLSVGASLVMFAWAGLAEVAIGAVGLVVMYRQSGLSLRKWRWCPDLAEQLLSDSWPLILSALAIYVQARIDQVMLGQMIGDVEVGEYSVAMRLIEAFAFVPMIIQSSVAPAITRAKARSEDAYWDALLNVYRIMFILFLAVATPVFLFSDKIVHTLFGDAYSESAFLLSLFSVRLFFTNFGVAKSLFITNENLFRYSLFTAVLGAIVNVALNYFLIPRFSSAGAIIATIVSFFVTTFFVDIFFPPLRSNLRLMIRAMLSPWKFTVAISANSDR
jgi:O-antigen/teichoic acid export membrane protein